MCRAAVCPSRRDPGRRLWECRPRCPGQRRETGCGQRRRDAVRGHQAPDPDLQVQHVLGLKPGYGGGADVVHREDGAPGGIVRRSAGRSLDAGSEPGGLGRPTAGPAGPAPAGPGRDGGPRSRQGSGRRAASRDPPQPVDLRQQLGPGARRCPSPRPLPPAGPRGAACAAIRASACSSVMARCSSILPHPLFQGRLHHQHQMESGSLARLHQQRDVLDQRRCPFPPRRRNAPLPADGRCPSAWPPRRGPAGG